MVFQGLSAVTFPTLGLRAEVSRRHGMAGLFDLVAKEPLGMLHRHVAGYVDWQSTSDTFACPVEVFDVVSTMI